MNGLGALYQSEDDYDDYVGKGTITSQYSGSASSIGNLPPTASCTNSAQNQSSNFGQGQGNSNVRGQTCCLVDDGRRCHRQAGNASYSKRIQKTVYYKRLRLENDTQALHIYICDYHKMVIQNARTRQKRDTDDEMNEGDDVPEVDLYQLQVNTLRRYKKHYKIPSRPSLNKAQLADILMRHFKTIPVSEKEIVTYFIYTVKSERNKLDNNRPDGSGSEYPDRY
jgi:histone deacetylase complex subunit SAP30